MILNEYCLANHEQEHIMRLINNSDGYPNNDKYYSIAVNRICCLVINQHLETQLTDTVINLSRT